MRLTRALPHIPDAVRAAFDRRLDPGVAAPVAVAYSGGGDSLYLLLAAKVWADRAGRRLLALHIDHRLQPQSAAWADAVRAVAVALGAGFGVLPWTGDKPATGLPAAARTARLTLLAEAARAAGAHAILLGHTADDVRESDFMRMEGSTLGHMGEWTPSPIWPEGRGLFHFRPLLDFSRADIRRRLEGSGWDWIDDPANQDFNFGRPRARARLSSALPGDREAEARSSQCRGPDDTRRRLDLSPGIRRDEREGEWLTVASTGAISAKRGELARNPQTLKGALVCASGGSKLPRTERLERLSEKLASSERFTATLSGARIEARDDVLICRDAGEYVRGRSPQLELKPGGVEVWDGRFEVTCEQSGWSMAPLKGLATRLPKPQREALRAIPAAARPSLPVLADGAETVTCPFLAEVHGARVRSLVTVRLAAALGLIRSEAEAVATAHGAGAATALSWGVK